MIYLPPFRRFLFPALILVTLVILYRGLPVPNFPPSLVVHPAPAPPQGIRVPIVTPKKSIPIRNASDNYLSPPNHFFYSYDDQAPLRKSNKTLSILWQPILDADLAPLFLCPRKANRHTGHIRLPNILQNISQVPPDAVKPDTRTFWNPTIIGLPYWSENQYLIVSRIVTDGNHQENVICFANVCNSGPGKNATRGEKKCTPKDLAILGPAGGMRCSHTPVKLSVPPTPAEQCFGKFRPYADIPGFHDPRIFWSGKGEPLMMCNTQSRYACFGLWLIDLRSLHAPLQTLLASSPSQPSIADGPLKSYPTLTELTRNPPSTRSPIEKNWMLFFPPNREAYIHYDLPPIKPDERGRTFAKLLGNGLTTTNLTDPLEQPCLRELTQQEEPDEQKLGGQWHQATNSLRLILCNRSDPTCKATPSNTVFFALIHRKHFNALKLPMRYERFFMVWASTPPFGMIGVSRHPILMANETARGWSEDQNWEDDPFPVPTRYEKSANATEDGKPYWAEFTYTVSIAYAWGRQPRKGSAGDESEDMHVGYLDDEVVLGIGVDDAGSVFSRVKAAELVQCMRACPGRLEKRSRRQGV